MGLLKVGQRRRDKTWSLSQSIAVNRYQIKGELYNMRRSVYRSGFLSMLQGKAASTNMLNVLLIMMSWQSLFQNGPLL